MFKKVAKKAAGGRIRENDDEITPTLSINSDQQMLDQTSSKVEDQEDEEDYKRKVIQP
jgi:hypothetical protein